MNEIHSFMPRFGSLFGKNTSFERTASGLRDLYLNPEAYQRSSKASGVPGKNTVGGRIKVLA